MTSNSKLSTFAFIKIDNVGFRILHIMVGLAKKFKE